MNIKRKYRLAHKRNKDRIARSLTNSPNVKLASARRKKILEYLKGYLHHSALNAGQATRDIRYIHDYPRAKGVRDSIRKRLKSLANNVKYTALPPTELKVGKRTLMKGHHSREELKEMLSGNARKWFKRGYAPWDNPIP